MMRKSCRVSRSVRDEVGSSITTARASPTRARAMATICPLAAESRLTEAATAGAGPLAAHEQVLGDRELGEQVELLGDHGDAGSLGVARRGERSRLAVHFQAALVGLVEPVHDLHERA